MMLALSANSPSGGYNLQRSLPFRSSASAYLNRTPASAGSRTTWTWSGWVKIGAISANDNALFMALNNASGVYNVNDWSGVFLRAGSSFDFIVGNGGSVSGRLVTTQAFRDFASWYHLVFTYDSTNATSTDRMRMYVNGSRVTAFSTATYPSINTNSYQNSTNSHFIAQSWLSGAPSNPFDGYLADVNFIDGQALTPSSFGSTNSVTGVWQPKAYSGTYGTNGFYLPFTDNSALTTSSNVGLGRDYSGNGNYWTTNNISITSGVTYDSMTDVPTLTSETAANYAVLNPIDNAFPGLFDGNLRCTDSTGSWGTRRSTIAMTSGKYYFEMTAGSANSMFAGLVSTTAFIGTTYLGNSGNGFGYYSDGTPGASYTTNDIIGVAYDAAAQTCTFYKNNVSQYTVSSIAAGIYHFAVSTRGSTVNVNFGQRPFAYTPPTGFKALNTFNLPNSTILAGNKYMDATLYTGNGSTQTITNAAGFRPDLVWIKNRNNTRWHILTDSVRGTNSQMFSNDTAAQEARTDRLTAFNSNGFSVGSYIDVNNNADTFVGWQWQANGAAVTNTSGTITSQVSANTSAGFSVVTYTGTGVNATVGHGLGVAPKLVIVKKRNGVQEWMVGSSSLTSWNNYLVLNTTAAQAGATTIWNNTAPTSSVFSVGNSTNTNGNTNTFVAYCFAEIDGYSKFGSYTGNGSADGPFVYLGFRPRYIFIKRTDTSGFPWWILDTARNTYNVADLGLYTNTNDSESAAGFPYTTLDFVSNGIKLRNTAGGVNASGGIYIYAAFAENPFKNALAR
jgi:hypothetical protein